MTPFKSLLTDPGDSCPYVLVRASNTAAGIGNLLPGIVTGTSWDLAKGTLSKSSPYFMPASWVYDFRDLSLLCQLLCATESYTRASHNVLTEGVHPGYSASCCSMRIVQSVIQSGCQ